MRSLLIPGILALAATLAPSAADAARDEPRCHEGRWTVDGAGLFPDDPDPAPDVLVFDGRRVSIADRCGPATARTKRRAGGIAVKARWRRCAGARSVTLRAVIDPLRCRTLAGSLRARTPALDVPLTASRAIRLLVFTRTAGFRHPSIADARRVLGALDARDGIEPTLTEDPSLFTDERLARTDVVAFVNTTGNVLDEAQQAAVERFVRRGGGFVGVHSAADTEYDWPWYGRLVGAYFRNHPLLPVTVTVTAEDTTHPSTAHLPQTFSFTDEIYNFDRNPRQDNAVLLTVDESGFIFPNFPPGPSMGADHPVAWYKEFEGGRSFYTNLGHRPESWNDPVFVRHLVAGIRWAAEPIAWSRAVLSDDARNPLALAVAPGGRVYWVERTGELLMWDPATGITRTAAALPVDTTAENGLLGIALDPGFAANGHVYLYHSPPVADPPPATGPRGENVLSRFTARPDGTLDVATRVDLLRVPSERACCHEAGALAFGPDGTLFLSTGDNTNPFASEGRAPLDARPGREQFDARRTAGNPFDLRGKVLRINPDGSIPPGNAFPPDGSAGRPEVYVMGTRNPFRIAVDPATGRLAWGDVGPDAPFDDRRGPRGFDEINLADAPGNYGWPYCIADNRPYADVDFAAGSVGPAFVCDAFRPATVFYDYLNVSHLALGNALSSEGPSVVTGRTAIAGVFARRPPGDAPFMLPPPWADTLLMTDWTRDVIAAVDAGPDGALRGVRRLLPWERFRRPVDLDIGSDGALYVLEYGTGYSGDNDDAALSRVDYSTEGRLRPVAVLDASTDAGAAPLAVSLSAERSRAAGLGDTLIAWHWDFDGDGHDDATGPVVQRTFRRPGVYQVSLVVEGAIGGRSLPVSRQIIAGNAPPEVTILEPVDGVAVPRGQVVRFRGQATDAEDGTAGCGELRWEIFLGHNAHAHPLSIQFGCAITVPIDPPDDHGDAARLFYVVELVYRDRGGARGEPPITRRAQVRVFVGEPAASPAGAFLE